MFILTGGNFYFEISKDWVKLGDFPSPGIDILRT